MHEDSREYVLIITKEEEPLPPPVGSLASLQYGLQFLTFGAPCMIHEMHDEEDTNTNNDTLVEVQPSLLPAVGETFAPEEETLVFLQDFSKF